jgi:tellurite resistance protein TerC
VFSVTTDPYLVFASNIFAILGLRSLYFLLAGLLDRFVYLKTGLAALLVFAGAKILLGAVHVELPIALSLGVIVGILGTAIVASWVATHPDRDLALRRAVAAAAVGGVLLAVLVGAVVALDRAAALSPAR